MSSLGLQAEFYFDYL